MDALDMAVNHLRGMPEGNEAAFLLEKLRIASNERLSLGCQIDELQTLIHAYRIRIEVLEDSRQEARAAMKRRQPFKASDYLLIDAWLSKFGNPDSPQDERKEE